MNAFRDILGFAGNAADAVLLGGAVGKTRRRNQFSDYLANGQYDQAQQLALRNGEGAYAQLAQEQGLAAQGAARAKQDEENKIFSGLSIALSEITDPNARRMAFEAMKPGLAQRYGLDEEDFAQVPLADVNALRLFGQQFITPETQVDQRLKGDAQAEAARANMAGERLRGGELSVSQGNLALGRDRLGEDRRQFDATQAAKLTKGQPDQTQAARAFGDRQQRVQLITDTIDKAIEQVGPLSAGVVGASLDDPGGVLGAPRRALFGQGAANLRATIDTVAANIGFEELQRLRDNSPTGGALGQVTERELKFLQSVLASLSQDQEPKQLKARLRTVKDQIIQSWDRVEQAYRQDFGGQQSQPSDLSTLSDEDLDALERRLSGQ